MWNNIEKCTLLLIFAFILLSMNGDGASGQLKSDHVNEAEVHDHARFIRSDSAPPPPPVDIGKEILDVITGKKPLIDSAKLSQMLQTLVNEQLAKLLSLMVDHLTVIGQQVLAQASIFAQSLNQTVTSLGLNVLNPPQAGANPNPFNLFNLSLPNFPFPSLLPPPQRGVFNPLALFNLTLPQAPSSAPPSE